MKICFRNRGREFCYWNVGATLCVARLSESHYKNTSRKVLTGGNNILERLLSSKQNWSFFCLYTKLFDDFYLSLSLSMTFTMWKLICFGILSPSSYFAKYYWILDFNFDEIIASVNILVCRFSPLSKILSFLRNSSNKF